MSLMHDALREMDKMRPEIGSRQTPLTYDTTPSSPQKGPAVAMSTAARTNAKSS